MLNPILGLLKLKLILFNIKIQNINCDKKKFIHYGNLIAIMKDIFLEEKNQVFNYSEISNDLIIVVQNNDDKSYGQYSKIIYDILKKWFLYNKQCKFKMLYKYIPSFLAIPHTKYFYYIPEFLIDVYFDNEIRKKEKLDIGSKIFKNHYEPLNSVINIIHNKKSLIFQTLDELNLIFKQKYQHDSFQNLTIIILEAEEKNKHLFIKSIYTDFYEDQDLKIHKIDWKLFYDLKTPFEFENSIFINSKHCFFNKLTRENFINFEETMPKDLYSFNNHCFLYNTRVIGLEEFICYEHFYDVNSIPTKIQSCYVFIFETNNKEILKFKIFTQTKLESLSTKKDKIKLKETVYIIFYDSKTDRELIKFTYFIYMDKKPKSEIKIEEIEFKKPCDEKYFLNNLIDNSDTEKEFNFLPLMNLVEQKIDIDYFERQSGIYYIDSTTSQEKSDLYKNDENIVVVEIINNKDDNISYGQKKIYDFLFRFKKIIASCYSKKNYLRSFETILDTSFFIDFDEKIIGKTFYTNISIDNLYDFDKIRLLLKDIFDDAEISSIVFYDFKPFVYSQYFDFDFNATTNLDFIDKQNKLYNVDIQEEFKSVNMEATLDKTISCLRFFYTVKKKINNENVLFNAQFFYYENFYYFFSDWWNDVAKIDKLITDCFKINQRDLLNHQINLTICKILEKLPKLLIFGLILNEKNSENILKGIFYYYIISENLFLKEILNQNSFLKYSRFTNYLQDFEKALLICNLKVIKEIENDISQKLILFNKNFEDYEQEIRSLENLQFKIYNITNYLNVLFPFFLNQFKKNLKEIEFNNYECILTISSEQRLYDYNLWWQIHYFKSIIMYRY
ncbi:hypothetical protein GVAV_000958 [Gurleya vavrai]